MEDKTQTNQVQTASMNRTKAPQKVEVVVANSSAGSEVNILGELSIFVLRIGFCALMIHHGLEKLQDPQGFAQFVVGKYFPFLPLQTGQNPVDPEVSLAHDESLKHKTLFLKQKSIVLQGYLLLTLKMNWQLQLQLFGAL